MLNLVLVTALTMLCLAFALTAWRLFRGPSAADRVLALDTLYVIAIGIVLLTELAWGATLYVEIAVLIALLGFVGTVAAAKYLTHGRVTDE